MRLGFTLLAMVWLAGWLQPSPCRAGEASLAPSVPRVGVGVLAFRGKDHARATWQPTVDYLNDRVSGASFFIVPLNIAEMEAAVRQARVGFIITNPGDYVALEAKYGASRIATLESRHGSDPKAGIGTVIISRRDRPDIRKFADLKGKTVMAVAQDAFGGFQVAWRELAEQGVDPFTDLAELRFVGFPQDKIVYAVHDGVVDAGVVRACLLERMATENKIDTAATFRVLNPQRHAGFRCAVSSRLYPDWPFAKLTHTPGALAKEVARALLAMSSDSPAARAGGYVGWTSPVDYQPVHDLFRELRIGPYAWMAETVLSELIVRYRYWLFALAIGVVWSLWHVGRVEYLVRVRTAELSEANERLKQEIAERQAAEERVRMQQMELAHVSRVSTVGELASGLAHELNQPLSAIISYAHGCARRLENGTGQPQELLEVVLRIAEQAERAGVIIQRLRHFLRKKDGTRTPVDINATTGEAADMFRTEALKHGVAVTLDLARHLPPVYGEMIQIEQVILNLMRNAMEAMADLEPPQRRLVIGTRAIGDDEVEVSVRDNGRGLSGEERRRLFEPFFTTKPHGMGLGMSISRSIIEAHGGSLEVLSNPDRGLTVRFRLPLFKGNVRDAS